ncbi:hypothetical protein BDY24DRAFT_416601 [Mrakia frigida]|uniref:uncharacterized protein n=1 Tax=Mrakia frigida TaxID=29902 RepID=UPI003FCC1011
MSRKRRGRFRSRERTQVLDRIVSTNQSTSDTLSFLAADGDAQKAKKTHVLTSLHPNHIFPSLPSHSDLPLRPTSTMRSSTSIFILAVVALCSVLVVAVPEPNVDGRALINTNNHLARNHNLVARQDEVEPTATPFPEETTEVVDPEAPAEQTGSATEEIAPEISTAIESVFSVAAEATSAVASVLTSASAQVSRVSASASAGLVSAKSLVSSIAASASVAKSSVSAAVASASKSASSAHKTVGLAAGGRGLWFVGLAVLAGGWAVLVKELVRTCLVP